MALRKQRLTPKHEPKSSGLTYLSHTVRAQSRGKAPTYIYLPYEQAKQIQELWRKDKAQLANQKALITRLEGRLSVLDLSQKPSQSFFP